MAKGFEYLVAVMGWYSRRVLACRLSVTLDAQFCVDALEEAVHRYGAPEVFNTDQGIQFASEEFTGLLKKHQIKTTMDDKSRWLDNVFVERLWRSVKYEEVYQTAYASVTDARQLLEKYFTIYNQKRHHQSLNRQTPDRVYYPQATREAACPEDALIDLSNFWGPFLLYGFYT